MPTPTASAQGPRTQVKRYQRRAKGVLLRAENPAYKDMEVSEERVFEVWGVVTKSIRML